MKAIFNIISKKTPIRNQAGFAYFAIGTIVSTSFLLWISQQYKPGKLVLFVLVIIAVLLFRFSRRSLTDWIKKKNYTGELQLDSDEIRILEKNKIEIIKIKELVKLKLIHSHIRGEQFGKGSTFNGIAEINLQTKDQKSKLIKFIIENKDQFSNFKQVLKSWYLRGLNIEEYFSEGKLKSLNLEVVGNKTFEEIQKIKEELNLK
jgi:hypothetical protein